MFKLTKLISFLPDATDSDRKVLAAKLESVTQASSHVLRARLQPAGPDVVNGGDLVWHVQFADEDAYRACIRNSAWREVTQAFASDPVSHVDGAAYRQGSLTINEAGIRNGIHRTLLLAIRPAIRVERIAQFEAEMREMARYVPAIRNWGFSRTTRAWGDRSWTHVWEQEFESVDGLFGPYMMHPIHFGHIDRWFDTESHDWIVETRLCHTYCELDRSMLTPPEAVP